MTVAPNQFTEFFRDVNRDPKTGQAYDPFPWQRRLAEQVCTAAGDGGLWPDALALPTGSGKTTCIDIAVFALACQAELPTGRRTAPRRIIFVVDRRVIVDEAFEHALSLARRLRDAKDGLLKEVADALRAVAGSDTPLTCHQLRGGVYRDDAWARTPSQPCVIASTVDQIGSRLLFRGYGRSFKSWPVQAGLAGNDALVLLDEAHCANPFRQTMQAVDSYRRSPWAERLMANPFRFAILSATPPADCGHVMAADDDDRSHPVLGRRIRASKPTRLRVAEKAKGAAAQRELAITLVEEALECVARHRQVAAHASAPAVGILVNRVLTAKLMHELLLAINHFLGSTRGRPSTTFDARTVKRLAKQFREQFGDSDGQCDCELMTGRMRPIDRQDVTDVWLQRLSAGQAGSRQLDRPVFITATQCLEVGANLDFDIMVNECASLDALRQRFGRLNRTGRDIPAPAAVVIRKDQEAGKAPDPVYAESLAATWAQLLQWRDASEDDTIDFSVSATEARWDQLDESQRAALVPPAPDAPVMLPAHVDCWVQTSPEPEPTPDVSIFLHGPQRRAPEVQVCWRSDLPSTNAWPLATDTRNTASEFERAVTDAVSLCSPSSLECLAVPRHLFLRWWLEQTDAAAAELADVDAASEDISDESCQRRAAALIWRGPEDSRLLRDPYDLRPGDTLVLPADAGGWDVFGHVPLKRDESIDVGDRCHWRARCKAVFRLRTEIISQWPETESGSKAELLQTLAHLADDPDVLPDRNTLLDLLHDIASQDSAPQWLRDAVLQGLPKTSRSELQPHPFDGLVLRGRRRVHPETLSASDVFTTEDDTASAGGQVSLQSHCQAAGERAREFARRCDLPDFLVETIYHAGRVHDLGKADRRFQAYLFGGNRQVADLAIELFAKSAGLRDDRRSYNSAWDRAGLPDGFRHELLSVQFAERFPHLLSLPPESVELEGTTASVDIDLLLHLVGMHHGYGRPFAPVVFEQVDDPHVLDIDLNPAGISLEIAGHQRQQWPAPHRLDSAIAERFWRLVRRYGWWGLAWLEAIFVLADHRTSEAESEMRPPVRPRVTNPLQGAAS